MFVYQVDPGEVKGTKLRILKYPHPKVMGVNRLTSLIISSPFQVRKSHPPTFGVFDQ